MTPIPRPALWLVTLAVASLLPAATLAQAVPTRPGEAPTDNLSAQDRDMLAGADQLAGEASQILEQWLVSGAITEDRLFSRLYYPVPKTDPQKWNTPYDALADRDLLAPEDKALGRSPLLQYAIVTDINGYVPTYNSRFAQPLTGNLAQDYVDNRTKRMLGDGASFFAAHSEARFLLQRARNDTGDVLYDVSVPVLVRGRHWGCVRIGYRRSE